MSVPSLIAAKFLKVSNWLERCLSEFTKISSVNPSSAQAKNIFAICFAYFLFGIPGCFGVNAAITALSHECVNFDFSQGFIFGNLALLATSFLRDADVRHLLKNVNGLIVLVLCTYSIAQVALVAQGYVAKFESIKATGAIAGGIVLATLYGRWKDAKSDEQLEALIKN
ncbi:hypothetical protein [Salinisphaera shabanensis]|uniref:hypothetical protein n=1 Tax=Salinisphaera shabanensis TaxID=180542 RepID=UPI00334143AA